MRFDPMKRIVVASALAAACGLVLANRLPSSISAPKASVLFREATVSPFAIMTKAPFNLPVEQYDAN